jgi:hypothetical protein
MSAFEITMVTAIIICSWVSVSAAFSFALLCAGAKQLPFVGGNHQ